jgi:hypothetical protein
MNLKYGKICNAIPVWCTVGSSTCDMYIVPEQHPACRLENHNIQRLTCGKINVLLFHSEQKYGKIYECVQQLVRLLTIEIVPKWHPQ